MEIQVNGIVKNITNRVFGKSPSIEFIFYIPDFGDFKAFANMYLPLHENDIVSGKAMYHEQDRYIVFQELPFVQISIDKQHIKQCFILALRGSGFGEVSADKLYNIFLEIGKKLSSLKKSEVSEQDSVVLALNDFAAKFNKTKEESLIELLINKADIINLKLTNIQVSSLLVWWYKNRSLRRLYLIGLNNLEIEECGKILKAVGVLQKKPYGLEELYQICVTNPFSLAPLQIEKAKTLSKMFNISITDEHIQCGSVIRYIYEQSVRNAWTCTPLWMINKKFPTYTLWRDVLIEKYYVYIEYNCWYLAYQYIVEKEIANYITQLISKSVKENEKKVEEVPTIDLPNIESATYTCNHLVDEQKIAIQGALQNNISVITGPPGSGKSSVIKEIINNLKLRKIPHMSGSFTGKAVSRLKEVTGEKSGCYTLDRMINNVSRTPPFEHLIIDETSMVTSELLYRFIRAFPKGFRITFVGDKDQLPPVTWGTLFTALLDSGKIPVYRLTINHRIIAHNGNNNDRYILNNANSLVDPSRELSDPFEFESGPGFHMLPSDINIVTTIVSELHRQSIPVEDVTCIVPFNNQLKELNEIFQTVYLSDKDQKKYDQTTWCVEDRVMMKYNNYDIDTMNGDIGKVTKITNIGVNVKFDGHEEEHEFKWQGDRKIYTRKGEAFDDSGEGGGNDELIVDDLAHCFTLTVHKSQGSEYKYVIIYIPDNKHTSFLNINLLYTAITRTKHTCWLIASENMISNIAGCKLSHRFDNLIHRIVELNKDVNMFKPIEYGEHNPFLEEEEQVYPDEE
jgi:DNA replication protein DnaC